MGYVVPCDTINKTIRIFGIHAEVDPRSGQANDKTLVISIGNVKNPSLGYQGGKNLFDVVHKRWSYPGGPILKVHESTKIPF